jgi:hypothetical protein
LFCCNCFNMLYSSVVAAKGYKIIPNVMQQYKHPETKVWLALKSLFTCLACTGNNEERHAFN